MIIVKVYIWEIYCDESGCTASVEGRSDESAGFSKDDLRYKAKLLGWGRRKVKRVGARGVADVCPKHLKGSDA